jgi:adenylate kinase
MNTHEGQDRSTWLKGPSAKCAVVPDGDGPAWRLVLLGAPGVGKGTQAEFLSQRLGACHLSTGDVFRAAKSGSDQNLTPALAAALDSMRRGALVADSIVSEVVRERIDCIRCPGGFILDGFPRTLRQAELLQEILEQESLALDAVVNYELSQKEVVARLSGRRTCNGCKTTFHLVSKPPRAEGICNQCGGRLYQREDDDAESIKVRLEEYERNTAPLIAFYENLGLLRSIPASGSPEEIYSQTMQMLGTRARSAGTICTR